MCDSLLAVLGGELVHPAQLRVAVLAHHIAHHVTAGQHDAILHVAELQVDDRLEQVGASCMTQLQILFVCVLAEYYMFKIKHTILDIVRQ